MEDKQQTRPDQCENLGHKNHKERREVPKLDMVVMTGKTLCHTTMVVVVTVGDNAEREAQRILCGEVSLQQKP